MAHKDQDALPRWYNNRGVADSLHVTTEHTRQLLRDGKIPVTALLNDKTPLVDEATLKKIAAERAAKQRRHA
jgi:predicted site-specific integrase-resolvase